MYRPKLKGRFTQTEAKKNKKTRKESVFLFKVEVCCPPEKVNCPWVSGQPPDPLNFFFYPAHGQCCPKNSGHSVVAQSAIWPSSPFQAGCLPDETAESSWVNQQQPTVCSHYQLTNALTQVTANTLQAQTLSLLTRAGVHAD